jgi:hypothetical protein
MERMDCLSPSCRVSMKQWAAALWHSLITVTLFVVVTAAVYVPLDRVRAGQRQHVTVLDCDLPTSDATVVSLVRVHSDQMKAGAELRLTLVDLQNERSTRELPWAGSLPTCIATSHDQRLLFVGTRQGQIFRLQRDDCHGPRELIADHPNIRPEQLAITRDHQTLLCRGFRWLGAWNLETLSLKWKRADMDCNAACLISNAALVCGTNTGDIFELSLDTGKTLRLLAHHKLNIRHLAAAGETLVGVDSAGEVILFRRQAGTWRRCPADKIFTGNNRLCLSSNGQRAVGSSRDNTTLICWDLAIQEPICHMTGHDGIILNAGFLPDDSVLSCGNDGTVRVWDLAAHGALRLVSRILPLFAG